MENTSSKENSKTFQDPWDRISEAKRHPDFPKMENYNGDNEAFLNARNKFMANLYPVEKIDLQRKIKKPIMQRIRKEDTLLEKLNKRETFYKAMEKWQNDLFIQSIEKYAALNNPSKEILFRKVKAISYPKRMSKMSNYTYFKFKREYFKTVRKTIAEIKCLNREMYNAKLADNRISNKKIIKSIKEDYKIEKKNLFLKLNGISVFKTSIIIILICILFILNSHLTIYKKQVDNGRYFLNNYLRIDSRTGKVYDLNSNGEPVKQVGDNLQENIQ